MKAMLSALWRQGRALGRAWRAAQGRVQLHALSDRALRDIGLTRDDIDLLIR